MFSGIVAAKGKVSKVKEFEEEKVKIMDNFIIKNKLYFNLNEYVHSLLLSNKIKNIDCLKIDTFNIKNKFFSARRALKLNHNDYGRNISIIMLN